MKLFIFLLIISMGAMAQNVSGTPDGTGAGSGEGSFATDDTSFQTGTFSIPNGDPKKDFNARAIPGEWGSALSPDPQDLNTAPNPAPELDPDGQLGDTTTLGTLPETRQAEEEKPDAKLNEGKKDLNKKPLK